MGRNVTQRGLWLQHDASGKPLIAEDSLAAGEAGIYILIRDVAGNSGDADAMDGCLDNNRSALPERM
jgi:hypothetical protein